MRKSISTSDLGFKKNLILYYCAVGVILLGYVFLGIGNANSFTSLTMGPVILVFGYLVAMPVALLSGVGRKTDQEKSTVKKKVQVSSDSSDVSR